MGDLPIDASDFTVEWLGQALGTEVTAVEVVGRGEATNLHLRLALTYGASTDLPPNLFVKLPPADPFHRQLIGASGMGVREADFYRDLSATCLLRVPACHHSATAADGDFVLLLEDLSLAGCEFSDGTWGVPADLAFGAVADLARFHVRYEDASLRPAWVTPRPPGTSDFILQAMRYVLDERAEDLSPDYCAIGELFMTHHDAMEALWDRGPQTFIHGDPHIGNVFLDGDRVGFHDWGLARSGNALRDVSYFITMSVDAAAPQRELLQHYVDARTAAGGSSLDLDEVWQAHREQASYNVIASFLGLTPTYDTGDGRAFAKAFRDRAMVSLEALDALGALRAALGA
jgi:hypothetical protein